FLATRLRPSISARTIAARVGSASIEADQDSLRFCMDRIFPPQLARVQPDASPAAEAIGVADESCSANVRELHANSFRYLLRRFRREPVPARFPAVRRRLLCVLRLPLGQCPARPADRGRV